MEKDFNKLLKYYCGERAIAHELQKEENYRGCNIWSFKRKVKKWRPTITGVDKWRKEKFDFNQMPEALREYYVHEYYTAITNYEIETEEEFDTLVMDYDRETAIYRLKHLIDKQFQLEHSMDDIL